VVRDEAAGTVLMDALVADKLRTFFAMDRAGTVKGFILYDLQALIAKTKIGTGAPVAVQMLYFMTFFIISV
jgi:hypothetical protein